MLSLEHVVHMQEMIGHRRYVSVVAGGHMCKKVEEELVFKIFVNNKNIRTLSFICWKNTEGF